MEDHYRFYLYPERHQFGNAREVVMDLLMADEKPFYSDNFEVLL